MRLDLAERLRCPRPHAPSPLVVVASEVAGRELRRGVAGCPVCRYEARFEGGDLFAEGAGPAAAAPPPVPVVESPGLAQGVERLAALLGLVEPGLPVLLLGEYAALGAPLAAATGAIIPTVVGFGDAVPFADRTFRGVAVGGTCSAQLADAAVRAAAVGARIVTSASRAIPAGVRELARDAREVVGEVAAAPSPVPLVRGARRDPLG